MAQHHFPAPGPSRTARRRPGCAPLRTGGFRAPRRLLAAVTAAAVVASLLVANPAAAVPGTRTATDLPGPTQSVAAPSVTGSSITLGDFDSGTDPWFTAPAGGTTATLVRTTDAPAGGTGAARFGVTSTDGPAELVRSVPAVDLTALEFQVRSSNLSGLVLRLTDSTGQTHQQVVPLTGGAAWQQVTVDTLAGGTDHAHWGGADDGVWHGSLAQMSFLVDSFRMTPGPSTTLDIDEVIALGQPPELRITPTTTGNAFATGDTVSFGVATRAQTLSWTVQDARGAVVGQGADEVADLGGTVDLGALPTGWYHAELIGTLPDGGSVVGGTDLSVLPASTVRDRRIGVSTHYGQAWSTDTVPLIAGAGLGFARDEAYWADQEQTRGSVTFTPKVRSYSDTLQHNDIQFMDILAYGNPLYHRGEAPATDEGRAGYANYGLASVEEFGTQGAVYEVWNEWNIRDLAGPAGGTAANYVALLKKAVTTIKAVHPDAVIVGPALAPINDWQGWVDDFIAAGGLEYIDAFSTHPYNFTAEPEILREHLDHLRGRFTAAGHPDLPVWITEQGWHTSTSSVGVSEEVQSRNLVRAELTALADGVERFTIYDLKDDGTDPSEPEHRFGIIRHESDARGAYTPKPAYVSQGVLTRAIGERAFLSENTLGAGNHGVVFGPRPGEPSGTRLQALFAGTAQTWTVAASGPVRVTDFYGTRSTLVPDATGRISVPVGPEPVYLLGVLGAATTTSTFSLAAGPAVTDEPVPATWTVRNSGTAPLTVGLQVPGGSDLPAVTVAAGAVRTVPLTLPATPVAGTRTWTATVVSGAAAVGLLSATATVRAGLEVSGSHAITDEGAGVLRLRVTNNGASARVLDRLDHTLAERSGVALQGVSIGAGQTLVADVPLVGLTGSNDWTAALTAGRAVTTSGTVVVAEPVGVPFRRVGVDGTLDPATARATPIVLDSPPAITDWSGPQDHSGKLWLSHDGTRLYLTAVITDDVQAQPARTDSLWMGDGVQIGTNVGWPGEVSQVSELGTALTDAGPVDKHRWLPAGASTSDITSAVKRNAATHTTTYELSVPLSSLGVRAEDRVLSATVAFNENDGAGRRGWSTWGEGVAESKNPLKFNALQLLPERVGAAVAVTAQTNARCLRRQAAATLTVANRERVPVDLTISTPWGERTVKAVAPGRAVTWFLDSGRRSFPAGSMSVAAQMVGHDGMTSRQTRSIGYRAISC